MPKFGEPEIKYEGEIFEVVETPVTIGDKEMTFSNVRRAPGTRLIIRKDDNILLSKEYRHESKTTDYRLPGGKVFDTLSQYKEAIKDKNDILSYALKAAEKECREETGLVPRNIKHYYTTSPTATVEWDLYYFIVDDFLESEQDLEHGEIIETLWKSKEEVKKMCLDGSISEERSALVLFRYLS